MRTGKIARLPQTIRDQLNSRLLDGEQGPSLLLWLNSTPQAKSVLAAHFDGRSINEVNLTEWRNGGYQDWLIRRDALAFAEALDDKDSLGHQSLDENMVARLVHWVSLQYAASARALIAAESDPAARWSRLRQLCSDVIRLRRAELAAERLQLGEDRLFSEDSARQAEIKQKLIDQELRVGTWQRLLASTSSTPKKTRPKKRPEGKTPSARPEPTTEATDSTKSKNAPPEPEN